MGGKKDKTGEATLSPPSVTVSRHRSLRNKASAAQTLENGPFLETATTHEGKLITQVSPPASPALHNLAPPSESGRSSHGQKSGRRGPRKNSFAPRPSPLDWETLELSKNPMRGFFTLFWWTMAYWMASTLYFNWRKNGKPVGADLFATMFSQGSWFLLFSDMVLVLTLFNAFFITKLFVWGWLPRSMTRVIQHIYQTTWFFSCLYWVYHNNYWSWTQSGFFTLHTISMLMKQHSYMEYNNEMLHKHHRLKRRQKRMDEIAGELKKISEDTQEVLDLNEEWEMCKAQAQELQVELCKGNTMFPANVTIANYADYLLVPTLVYELEYPRTHSIRPWYVLEKSLGIVGIIMVLYVLVEHYIYPVLNRMGELTFFESLSHLLLPFMVAYMLIFYVIFECICNWFAEVTRFADREFYEDWWNSVTWDEYARKWNKPVHEFLLRHVYLEGISTYKLSKTNATFLTFFLSSCMHELVMVVLAKRIRMYLFFLQMGQLPLVFFSRWSKLKSYPRVGNGFFWFGLYLGPPFLAVAYCRELWKVGQEQGH
ncbi:MBOAT, membrane-bound O-acyltransferase family-domain-containing protein [Phlyctochytrium arcticum]|nr:MBOAT, membrane-bound O-acyltransferase family-domain-containing protein [Phlyctochytrium arcticum]